MRLFHLLQSHDTSKPTGVPRFSGYFKQAFPDVVNITPASLSGVDWQRGDICVADNHYSLMVPERVPCIVVHHGCAEYHYKVDESWRNSMTNQLVTGQRLMLHKANRLYVAPSKWVYDRFAEFAPSWYAKNAVVVPHYVPLIHGNEKAKSNVRPRVIGDWRNPNKGSEVWREIQRACADEFEFCPLQGFDGDDCNTQREDDYRRANVYICLSLSEGAPYSVADAEAASLPIVSTHCGNVHEFEPVVITQHEREEQPEAIAELIRYALEKGRQKDSFYKDFTFTAWQQAWQVVISEVQTRAGRA